MSEGFVWLVVDGFWLVEILFSTNYKLQTTNYYGQVGYNIYGEGFIRLKDASRTRKQS